MKSLIAKFVCLKSAGKALSWRVTASSETFVLGWLLTGSWKVGASIASVEVFSKFFLFYAHERAWAVVPGWFASRSAEPAAVAA